MVKEFGQVYGRGERPQLEGEKVKVQEILGQKLEVEDLFQAPSTYRKDSSYVMMQAKLGSGKRVVFATAAAVVARKLLKAKEDGNLPLACTIVEATGKKGQKYLDVK